MSLYVQLRSSVSHTAVCFYWDKKQEERTMNETAASSNTSQERIDSFFPTTRSSYVRPLTDQELVTACLENPGQKWKFAICSAVSGEQQGIGTDLDTILCSAQKAGVHIYVCH